MSVPADRRSFIDMALLDDLTTETDKIVRGQWKRREGTVVPETEGVGLGNEAVDLEATFVYADLHDSTRLAIDNQQVAAEVFKAYLMGTTRIIRALGGEIRSFDGDRVMGVFVEGAKNTNAVEAGLKINYFFREILTPAFNGFYTRAFPLGLSLNQTVGIDTSKVMVVRSGIRKNNDLVWVGRAPNIAAKLSGIREVGYSTYMTKGVFDVIVDSSKFGGNPKQLMWESRTWNDGGEFGVSDIYRSGWQWKP
jgi:adenylate cyclase